MLILSLDQAGILYGCLLVSNLFLLVGQSFSAILSALQKIYINNLLQMVYNFIGIREVGFFEIALKVKAQFQGLITRLIFFIVTRVIVTGVAINDLSL